MPVYYSKQIMTKDEKIGELEEYIYDIEDQINELYMKYLNLQVKHNDLIDYSEQLCKHNKKFKQYICKTKQNTKI